MPAETVGRPMEILLVEDTLEDARVTIDALQQGEIKCRVTLVREGEEAMVFLRREGIFSRAPRPDLILLDMQLPKKDGRQILEEIRVDDQLKDIPVVVLTASEVHKVVLQGAGLHVDSYMTKPVSWEQFIRVVKQLRQCWIDRIILPELD